MKIPILLFMIAICLLSCEKIIEVKLNDSEAMYIIEGEITDAEGPYEVRVSRSRNFNDINGFTAESGAMVILFDLTQGAAEKLKEASAGVYKTAHTKGKRGHVYKLEVTAGGRVFTATSTIPNINVRLEQLYTQVSDYRDNDIYVVPVYTDPAGVGNYYLLRQYVNGQFIPGSVARSDEATDGNRMLQALTYLIDENHGRLRIKVGDRIKVSLQGVDKGVYDYFRTFENTSTMNKSNPANPLTNFSGGALGVFNACTVSVLEATVKPERP
ncbi:hypothetical protein IWX76_002763 [Pedobacter sp. CAN_A7]|uniref:DUF4249 domain-containing protein n=1 Tax=Pedobacter sp. CAN_A7 TaxID=2787722 RepID=UPI0018C967ED